MNIFKKIKDWFFLNFEPRDSSFSSRPKKTEPKGLNPKKKKKKKQDTSVDPIYEEKDVKPRKQRKRNNSKNN